MVIQPSLDTLQNLSEVDKSIMLPWGWPFPPTTSLLESQPLDQRLAGQNLQLCHRQNRCMITSLSVAGIGTRHCFGMETDTSLPLHLQAVIVKIQKDEEPAEPTGTRGGSMFGMGASRACYMLCHSI